MFRCERHDLKKRMLINMKRIIRIWRMLGKDDVEERGEEVEYVKEEVFREDVVEEHVEARRVFKGWC